MEFRVMFENSEHGTTEEYFSTFAEASEFWNEYADTPTLTAGNLVYMPTNEVIWELDVEW